MLFTLTILAANLRACITGVGSLIPIIRADLGLSNTLAGLITTLPLLVFAAVSPAAAQFSRRFGFGRAVLFGLLALFLGEGIRSYTNTLGLFLGTALMALGITIGNVLLVSLIKFLFPDRVGSVTGIYSTSMALSACVSIGISVPVAVGLGLGWRNALSMWMILAFFSIVLWISQMPRLKEAPAETLPDAEETKPKRSVYRSKLAWQFAAFFGFQSLLFYSLTAWVPSILQSRGFTVEQAATVAFLLQLFNLPSTLLVPILCARYRDQRLPLLVFSLLFLTGTTLFLFSGKSVLTYISIIIAALGMGSGLGFGNLFISLRTRNAQEAAALSGMGQCLGYLFAAAGPVFLGFLFDLTGSWTLPLLFILCCILLMSYFGLKTARDRFLFD